MKPLKNFEKHLTENKTGLLYSAIVILVALLFLAWNYPDTDYFLETKMQYGAPGTDVDWSVRAGLTMLIGSAWSWLWSWWWAWGLAWYVCGLFLNHLTKK